MGFYPPQGGLYWGANSFFRSPSLSSGRYLSSKPVGGKLSKKAVGGKKVSDPGILSDEAVGGKDQPTEREQ